MLTPAVVAVAVVVAAFGAWLLLGTPRDEIGGTSASPAPAEVGTAPPGTPADPSPGEPGPAESTPTAPAVASRHGLLERFAPGADGRITGTVTGQELTAVANDQLPEDSPVESVELQVVGGDTPRPRVDFTASLRDAAVEVAGTVALDVVDGTVQPEVVDARMGPLPLSGGLRAPVDDVVDDAARIFDDLAARGVEVTGLGVDGAALRVEGRVADEG